MADEQIPTVEPPVAPAKKKLDDVDAAFLDVGMNVCTRMKKQGLDCSKFSKKVEDGQATVDDVIGEMSTEFKDNPVASDIFNRMSEIRKKR